jgi:ceramide glucosyltransferase
VLVAVPVRGDAGLDAFLASLAAQDYPAWRVVFAVEDRADPASAPLARFAAARPSRAQVVVAGPTDGRAQKVQNLLAVLPALRPDDAALVTLDADTLPPPDMLTELLRPVLAGQGAIASGYRWSLPASPRAGSLLLSLAEMGVATLPRCARCNLCWGGATAIGRQTLERLDLPSLWDRAVSDDLSLSRAAHRARLVIYAPLTVRPPSPVDAGAAEAFRFGLRQHRLMRLHSPGRWLMSGLLLASPTAGGAAALGTAAATGNRVALACIVAAWLLGRVRAELRGAIARRVLPPAAAADAMRALRRGWWAQPLAHALHLAAWIGSATGDRLHWAGRRYRLSARGAVRDVERLPPGGSA